MTDDPYFSQPGEALGSKPASNVLWWLRVAFLVLLAMVGAFILLAGAIALLFRLEPTSYTKELSSDDAIKAVANLLVYSELLGPVVSPDPDYASRRLKVANRILGGRGFTESDGFHGDGTDWYEADLSPELMAKLRVSLPKMLKPPSYVPISGQFAPPWWPRKWPEGTACFEQHLVYLILPPTGTRLWVQVIRT